MIPLPPAELTAVKAPINDIEQLGAKIESVVCSDGNLKEGCRILIKPSAILLDRRGRGSHIAFLTALIRVTQKLGGLVSIGDSPGAMLRPTEDYWRESGLADLADRFGCDLFNFEASQSEAVMVDSRVYYLPIALNEFDLIINAAAFGPGYDNNLSGVLQNCLGFLPGRQLESWDKPSAAVDLYAVVNPQLNILQFDYQGETRLLIGADGVAVDTTFFSRLKQKNQPKCLRLAAEAGIGIGHIEMIAIEGDSLPNVIDLAPPQLDLKDTARSILERIVPINVLKTDRIVVSDRCDGCTGCCDLCPTGSISMSKKGTPIWNVALCVECWRCRESCPSHAISISIARFAR
jgi:ferredoxin